MSSFLKEETGVAMSGVKWDVAGYKLWQSVNDNVVLFTPKQPRLAKSENGRWQAGIDIVRGQTDNGFEIIGGTAVFTVTSAIQFDPNEFEQVTKQWQAEMAAGDRPPPKNPRFIPLNVRNGESTVVINPMHGRPHPKTESAVGTPGGTVTFVVELSAEGAQIWANAIKNKTPVPAGVLFRYQYLQMLPDVGAKVVVHGQRVFKHMSGELKASAEGFFYGGSVEIEAMWEKMTRSGAIEVEIVGDVPPELTEFRDNLVTSFSNQAREMLFDTLFEPKPDVKPAEAGNSGGLFGGANLALKWRKETDAVRLEQTFRYKGWTWLDAMGDADMGALLTGLDETYLTETELERSATGTVTVDADPMLEQTAVSWTPSEGRWPETPVFGATGGSQAYTLTSADPGAVEIDWKAKVNFTPRDWPIVHHEGSGTMADGENIVVIKPSSWIGRHMMYLFVKDGDEFVFDDSDFLIVNVSYAADHLTRTIKASARMTPMTPVEFNYPLGPGGEAGQPRFSAMGALGGRMVRAPEQPILLNEEAVAVLADRAAGTIELVSAATIGNEEASAAAEEIYRSLGRPELVSSNDVGGVMDEEPDIFGAPTDRYRVLQGSTVAVEYTSSGHYVVLETATGTDRVRLRDAELGNALDDESKNVLVKVGVDGVADDVVVPL